MNWQLIKSRGYLTRRQMESLGEPVGDPFAGPAYGEKNDPTTAVLGGTALLGGMMGADAAEDAANTQAAASDRATRLQKQMYDQTREDLGPYRQAGIPAINRLSYLLGLGDPSGTSEKYTLDDFLGYNQRAAPSWYGPEGQANDAQIQYQQYLDGTLGGGGKTDEWIGNEMGFRKLQPSSYASDGQYGSLLKNFTGQDLQNEPGYQFGLTEGQKGLDRRQLSGGNYFSGGALKAASRYNQDYAGTKFDNAFNRDSANKNRIYSMLSGLGGMGQNAAAQTGSAGTAAGQGMANTMIQSGNAQAAGQIGASNALTGGIGGAINAFQWNQALGGGNSLNQATNFRPWGGGINDYQGLY